MRTCRYKITLELHARKHGARIDALREMFKEVEGMQTSPLTPEELSLSKDAAARALAGRFETMPQTVDTTTNCSPSTCRSISTASCRQKLTRRDGRGFRAERQTVLHSGKDSWLQSATRKKSGMHRRAWRPRCSRRASTELRRSRQQEAEPRNSSPLRKADGSCVPSPARFAGATRLSRPQQLRG
jgi:hypothetical protein